MSLLRDTFNNQDKRRAPGSEKKLKKILQKKIVTFFQVESETILDLGMSALFQKVGQLLPRSWRNFLTIRRSLSRGKRIEVEVPVAVLMVLQDRSPGLECL
jgi:hypothetical protein